jgi:hypothetical protein
MDPGFATITKYLLQHFCNDIVNIINQYENRNYLKFKSILSKKIGTSIDYKNQTSCEVYVLTCYIYHFGFQIISFPSDYIHHYHFDDAEFIKLLEKYKDGQVSRKKYDRATIVWGAAENKPSIEMNINFNKNFIRIFDKYHDNINIYLDLHYNINELIEWINNTNELIKFNRPIINKSIIIIFEK